MPDSIGIYTCCTGNKDKVLPPEELTVGAKYFCYSTSPIRNPVYKYVPITVEEEFKNQGWIGNIKTSRIHKAMPHKLKELQDCDITIWTDSNIQIAKDISHLIDELSKKEYDIALFNHGIRNNIYEEREELKILFRDNDVNWSLDLFNHDPNIGDIEDLDRLFNIIEKSGFGLDFLVTTGILIRKNNEKVNKAMEDWSDMIKIYHRDQVSLPYIIQKHQLKIALLSKEYIIEAPLFHQYFKYYKHIT